MKQLEHAIFNNVPFWVFSITAIILLVVGFLLPPTGTIDPSVLGATGELFAFTALWTVIKALERGTDATIKHNNTEIEIKNPDNVE